MTTALPMQFKVGLVQMSMSDDPEANLGKAVARIRDAAQQGATLVCLPELFRTQYIGQREDHALFDLAEAVPGPTTETLGKIAKENGVVVIASLSSAAPRACITTRQRSSTPTARSRGSIARCTSPTTPR